MASRLWRVASWAGSLAVESRREVGKGKLRSDQRGNAAPEWQAGILGWQSRVLVVACPLEGPVRPIAPRHLSYSYAYVCCLRDTHLTQSRPAFRLQVQKATSSRAAAAKRVRLVSNTINPLHLVIVNLICPLPDRKHALIEGIISYPIHFDARQPLSIS
jgi:hypothetical protein